MLKFRWAMTLFASALLATVPAAVANHPGAPTPAQTADQIVDEVAGGAETCVPNMAQDAAADESLVCDVAANVKSVADAVQDNAPDPTSPEDFDPASSANAIATAVFQAAARLVDCTLLGPCTLGQQGDVGDSAGTIRDAALGEANRQVDHVNTLRQTVQEGASNLVQAAQDLGGAAANSLLEGVCNRPGDYLPTPVGSGEDAPDPATAPDDPLNAVHCGDGSVGENARSMARDLVQQGVASADDAVQNGAQNVERATGLSLPDIPSICDTAAPLCPAAA